MDLRLTIWIGLLLAAVAGVVSFIAASPSRSYSANYDDPDPAVRAAAIRQASRRHEMSLIARALKDPDLDVRTVALMELKGRLQVPREAAPALLDALKNRSAFLRREAARALSSIGDPVIPNLCQALSDPNPLVRAGAVSALGGVLDQDSEREHSPQQLAAITPLVKKLVADPDPDVRACASRLLKGLNHNR